MKTITINGITVTVQTSDSAFQKYGVPAEVPAAMVEVTADFPHPVVYTTTGFATLSDVSQAAVLAHEAGHVACGHLETHNEPGVLYDVPELEAQADAWASKVVGVSEFDRALAETVAIIKRHLGKSLTPAVEDIIDQQILGRVNLRQKYM